eukprot:Awhi_evm1s10153
MQGVCYAERVEKWLKFESRRPNQHIIFNLGSQKLSGSSPLGILARLVTVTTEPRTQRSKFEGENQKESHS